MRAMVKARALTKVQSNVLIEQRVRRSIVCEARVFVLAEFARNGNHIKCNNLRSNTNGPRSECKSVSLYGSSWDTHADMRLVCVHRLVVC